MSVTLRTRKMKDGSQSLWLDIYHNGVRTSETLKHLVILNASSPTDKAKNKETMRLANMICAKRTLELESSEYSLVTAGVKKVLVLEWMDKYLSTYDKKDIRNMNNARNRFEAFLTHKKITNLTFNQLDPVLIEEFQGYLESRSVGEGASTFYNRFKKMIRTAYRKNVTDNNVLGRVERKVKGKARPKDVLTIEEMQELIKTPVQSYTVRQAALFSSLTGLAWADIKKLKWSEIKLKDKEITIIRQKADGYQEVMTNPLNDTAIKLLPAQKDPETLVFDLPTADGANKTLKKWVRRAGIDKHITWHNLRHSFGTNIVHLTGDLLTASKLLMHTSTKHTLRYVRASEKRKRDASDQIQLNLDFE